MKNLRNKVEDPKKIGEYLVNKYRFAAIGTKSKTRYYVTNSWENDTNSEERGNRNISKLTHILRIGDVHYLFYSEELKYFSLAFLYDRPKGQAGGGYKIYEKILIPKLIQNKKDADKLILGIIGGRF